MDSPRGSLDRPRLPVGRLEGRTVLVTGAAAGLGRACALAVAKAGGNVVALDADGGALEALAEEVQTPERLQLSSADVSQAAQLDVAVKRALDRFGGIDGSVVNAGIAGEGTAMDTSEQWWGRVLDVNLTGAWLTARAVLPDMLRKQHGSIVFMSSITALVGRPGAAAYSAAKGGLLALTRQMAADVAPQRVRVNALCPGTVMTDMARRGYEARGVMDPDDPAVGLAALAAAYPLGRLGLTEDVADATVFLLGDGAQWITGAVLPVDGGLTQLDAPATRPPSAGPTSL